MAAPETTAPPADPLTRLGRRLIGGYRRLTEQAALDAADRDASRAARARPGLDRARRMISEARDEHDRAVWDFEEAAAAWVLGEIDEGTLRIAEGRVEAAARLLRRWEAAARSFSRDVLPR